MVSPRKSNNESPDLCKVEQKLTNCWTSQRKRVRTKKLVHLSTKRRADSQTQPEEEENQQRQQLTPPSTTGASKKKPTTFRTYFKRKKVQRGRGASEEQEQLQNQEPPTITTGHLNEVEDEVMRGRDLIPLEISSDEEDTKPLVDRLLRSEPVSSRNSHTKIPLEKRMEAAAVLKDNFVSDLEMNGHQMSISLMVERADYCFKGLGSLYVDFQPFQAEVLKLIDSYQKLKQINNVKNTGAAEDWKAAYEMSVLAANDAEEELHAAEYNVSNAQTKFDKTIEKIEHVKVTLCILEEEKTVARDELESSTTKWNHCNEAYMLAQKNVEEIGAKLEESKNIEEKIQSTLSRLHLVGCATYEGS